MAGRVRYIFTFDKNERKKDTIVFNDRTQKEILSEIYRTEGHEPDEYIFGYQYPLALLQMASTFIKMNLCCLATLYLVKSRIMLPRNFMFCNYRNYNI